MSVNEVAFLLDDPKGRGILNDLYIAQDNYIEVLNQWNLRSHIHVQQIQPALAAAGHHHAKPITIEQIDEALGLLLEGTIKRITENCITSLQRAFERLVAAKEKLRPYLVERFTDKEKFIDFVFPETWGLVLPSATVGKE